MERVVIGETVHYGGSSWFILPRGLETTPDHVFELMGLSCIYMDAGKAERLHREFSGMVKFQVEVAMLKRDCEAKKKADERP